MRRTMGVIYMVSMLGLVLAGCAKKEEQTAPPAPVEKATPAAPAQGQTDQKPVEQATQQAQEGATMMAQEANQVQAAAGAAMQQAQEAAQQGAAEQTVCPVMKDQPLNKEIFVEYKSKKVYFCCESCKATFEKEPEKYVKDLPQFKP